MKFARLLMFPNVIITGHQAFLIQNALQRIAEVTLTNISNFQQNIPSGNEVTLDPIPFK